MQDERIDTNPLAASVHKLASLVYGDRAHLAAAAIPCALIGFGVRLYRDYVAKLKVGAIAARATRYFAPGTAAPGPEPGPTCSA